MWIAEMTSYHKKRSTTEKKRLFRKTNCNWLSNEPWRDPRMQHLPIGMICRYLPRNLLDMVNSCQDVQSRPSVYIATVGGWWLTYTRSKVSSIAIEMNANRSAMERYQLFKNQKCQSSKVSNITGPITLEHIFRMDRN